MTKIKLSDEQIDALRRINAPYDPDQDYDTDYTPEITPLDTLLQFIEDYVVAHEIKNNEVTDFGEQLLLIHDYIVDKYDS